MWKFSAVQRKAVLTRLYTAFEESFAPDYVFRGESHDFYELVLLTEGCLGITANANSFLLEAPAAVLHPPMEFHSLRSERGTEPHVILFSFAADAMPQWEKHIFELNDGQIETAEKALQLVKSAFLMSDIQITGMQADKEREAQRAVLALEDLLLTLSCHDYHSAKKEGSTAGQNYRRALRVIESNLTRPLDTAELARLAHMSPSLLKKTFSRHMGVGVMEYVRTRKINAAIPLLRDGVSIQGIAERLGFSNAGYFSTVFRRVTGHTPSYYRNH